jgi:mannose-6-phosphate isomerase-like protein (cupin superfamily)
LAPIGPEDSSGPLKPTEDRRDAGQGPARHVHHRESDEAFHVLEGKFRFSSGVEKIGRGAGT